ncbi:MAG: hypothetical protein AAGF93_13825 [Cyanobacteria bacterium P01_H01_bin.105]
MDSSLRSLSPALILGVTTARLPIATLFIVGNSYAGRVRRIKWLGQGTDGLLSAEVTLMARSSAGVTVPGQLNGLPDADYPDGHRPVIGD